MLKFLTDYFNFITYVFEALAALTGILLFKKHKNTTTTYFIYFLFYVVFVDYFGASLIYFNKASIISFFRSLGIRSNNWYNLFWMFGSILFVLLYYHALLKTKCYRNIIKITGLVFVVIFIFHAALNFNLFLKSHPPIYPLLGAFTTFTCIAVYFIELLKNDSILNMFKSFSLYASIGLFLWWLIITPMLFFDLYNTVADWDFVNLKRRVFLFANIFMYTCFAIGLIVSKPPLKND